MKCSKCGAELTEDAKFCSYCGNKIEATTSPTIEEDAVATDVHQNETDKTSAKKLDTSKSLPDKIKDLASEKWHKQSTYGKIITVAVAIFVLLCLIAFLSGKIAAGIIAVLQIVLIVVSVLMKRQIIKVPKSWIHFIVFTFAIVLLVPYVSLFRMDYVDTEKFVWSDILLADVVPEPKSLFGEVIENSDKHLSLYVYKTSTTDYNKYVDACKEKGFTIEVEQSEQLYNAYDATGYKLSLSYNESDCKMHIKVEADKQYGTLVWPDSGIASMLPIPESATGEIMQDDEKGFQAYVSNTSIDEFKTYAAACADMGFNIDTLDSDESYSAENSEGYKLIVSYQGNNVISISVDEPEYEVSVEIECVENWAFSKYDVDVYIDDSFESTIEHGTTETFSVTMTKGIYEIKFVNTEDNEVTGTVTIDIHQDESLRYKISCTSTEIDVETIVGTMAEYGEDEAPMPQSASDYRYDNFADVQQELFDAGFTNISFEILYDIVLGWTEEGEIDNISVDGNTDFGKGDIFKKDVPIVITYHLKEEDDPNNSAESGIHGTAEVPETTTEPESTQNLTADNCPDLAALLALKEPSDPSVSTFASKYIGQIIEFDGCVTAMQNHGSYTTRWDVLLGAGDFDENSMRGPNFRLTDVNYNDMNVSGGDSVYVGLNVHVVAEVGDYDANTTLFELDIISMEIRD